MTTYKLRTALQRLKADDLRVQCPFSRDISETTAQLLAAGGDEERSHVLGSWLAREQPCIFGRLAAQRELVSYCFLTAEQLEVSDQEIASTIQTRRKAWQSLAEDGKRSAFVILALSQRVANAAPDETLKAFALHLSTLYLKREIVADRIYHDRVRLWELGFERRRQWRVGVNVFAAAGDRRWWHDHRIPGGLGFSMNSVGHLVAAEARRSAIQEAARAAAAIPKRSALLRRAEAAVAELQETSVVSLGHALKYAMHTIRGASERAGGTDPCRWGRATMLLRADPGSACSVPEVNADPAIREASADTYLGWYHTDVTVPSAYFRIDQARPSDVREPFALDFTYLHAGRGSDFSELARGITTDAIRRRRRPKAARA